MDYCSVLPAESEWGEAGEGGCQKEHAAGRPTMKAEATTSLPTFSFEQTIKYEVEHILNYNNADCTKRDNAKVGSNDFQRPRERGGHANNQTLEVIDVRYYP